MSFPLTFGCRSAPLVVVVRDQRGQRRSKIKPLTIHVVETDEKCRQPLTFAVALHLSSKRLMIGCADSNLRSPTDAFACYAVRNN